MNVLNYSSKVFRQLVASLLLLCTTVLLTHAQCSLTKLGDPITMPVLPLSGCTMNALTPNSFLGNLAANCPDAGLVGVAYNLKIYDTTGTVAIYDQNNAGGSNGVFPVLNVNALGLAGQRRKVRIERQPTLQFQEMEVIFQVSIACPSPVTLNLGDDTSISNPLLTPTNAAGCSNSLTNLCILFPSTTILPCNDPLGYQRINRSIKSSDGSTSICSQVIYLKKSDITTVIAAANYTDPANKGCAFTLADKHPSVTKFPTFANGVELAPDPKTSAQVGVPYTVGNVRVTYTDVLQAASCSGEVFYKRNWMIEDLCNASPVRNLNQDIRSKDAQVPTIQPIPDFTINTNTTSCNATNFAIPTATVADNCGTPTVAVTISNAGTSLLSSNGGTVASLGTGVYNVRYTVTDACGNAPVILNVKMTIIDGTAPTIVCSSKMISLNNVGTATVFATKFIDNVMDNCSVSLSTAQIKRMNDPDPAYATTLNVTCADLKNPFMVMLRVYDAAGNVNYCMTTAEVQDKLAPAFVNQADTTVFCPVDTNFLKSLNPIVSDGCSFTLVKQIKNYSVSNCQTGTLDLVYTAKDGGGLTTIQTRKVTIINNNPFFASMITKPKDITIKNFNGSLALLEPEKLDTGLNVPARPKWTYNGCDLVATSRHDDVYTVNGSMCCFKIIRTWKIANCCMMVAGVPGPKVVAEFVQVIKIEDTLPPDIKGMPGDVTVGTQNCLANFTLPKPAAIFDCASNLPLTSLSVSTAMTGQNPVDPFAFTNVPKGIYTITYKATDDCGNIGTYSFKVTVKDTTKPTAIVANGLATNVGSSGSAMLTARHFDKGSKDNCTANKDLIFAFSKDPKDTMLMIDCATFKPKCDDPVFYLTVKIWVRDEAGNWDFVDTYIALTKNNSPCTCFKNIAGAIETTKGEKVQDVLVNITSNGVSIVKPFTTGINGSFSVPSIGSNSSYDIAPKKNIDPTNGVSTADLVLMTKHILGQQPFDSPYQWIAADVNKSGKVSTADIVELRKLILGLNPTFVNNNSWRFVDKNYVFKNAKDPLAEVFPENKVLQNLNNSADFIAVKIGDINSTAKANNTSGTGIGRSSETFVLQAENMKIEAGQIYTIPVKAASLSDVAGYQFTLNFDKNALEFVSVKHHDNGSDADFGLTHLEDGVITTSWMNASNIDLPNNETVFTLVFKGKNKTTLAKVLKITSDYTPSEAYTQKGDPMNVELNFISKTAPPFSLNPSYEIESFELFQNQPNPFRNNTIVAFYLPEAAHAVLTVYDQTGRLLKKIEGDYGKGKSEIKVEDLSAAGLLIYRLDTPDHTATKRMLMIE
jgi:Cohesin domain